MRGNTKKNATHGLQRLKPAWSRGRSSGSSSSSVDSSSRFLFCAFPRSAWLPWSRLINYLAMANWWGSDGSNWWDSDGWSHRTDWAAAHVQQAAPRGGTRAPPRTAVAAAPKQMGHLASPQAAVAAVPDWQSPGDPREATDPGIHVADVPDWPRFAVVRVSAPPDCQQPAPGAVPLAAVAAVPGVQQPAPGAALQTAALVPPPPQKKANPWNKQPRQMGNIQTMHAYPGPPPKRPMREPLDEEEPQREPEGQIMNVARQWPQARSTLLPEPDAELPEEWVLDQFRRPMHFRAEGSRPAVPPPWAKFS